MPNYLQMPKQQQVVALLALGWSYRRIEAETGVHRETVSRYARLGAANPAITFPGSGAAPGETAEGAPAPTDPKPAITFAGSGANPAITFPGSARADFAQVVQSFRVKPVSGFAPRPSVISAHFVHRVASMAWA